MSVIIRLQNLPWSANALDIRQFFQGLSIPEGGVHIVGGEQGDAFIAFSTDEDARQAFQLNGGKIKEIQIKLMLSSRTEMQKVIETARNPLAAFMHATPTQLPPTAMIPTAVPAAVPEFKKDDKLGDKREKKRSRSKSRERKERSRERDRRDRRRRERSRSKSPRDRRDRRRRDRSRSRDRTRSKDRERKNRDRRRSEDKTSTNSGSTGLPKELPKIGVWESPIHGDALQHLQQLPSLLSNFVPANIEEVSRNLTTGAALVPDRSNFQGQRDGFTPRPNWGHGGGRHMDGPNNRSDFPNRNFQDDRFNSGNSRQGQFNNGPFGEGRGGFGGRGHLNRPEGPRYGSSERQPLLDRPSEHHRKDAGTAPNSCVQLRPFYGGYGDIRRFFQGIFINNTGIKFVNDEMGKRTGIVYVRFAFPEGKEQALQRSGGLLRNHNVEVSHLDDEIFENAVDRYQPERSEQSESDAEAHFKTRNITKFFNKSTPKVFTCLVIEDLPTYTKEQDILKMFLDYPILSIFVVNKPRRHSAYIKFSNAESAKKAQADKAKHLVDGKPVHVKPCSDEDFDGAGNKDQNDSNSEDIHDDSNDFNETESECIALTGLPLKTTDRDISDFFTDVGLVPEKIHLMSNNLGFTGKAFCEFASMEDAEAALEKDGMHLGSGVVTVKSLSRSEMDSILDLPTSNSVPPMNHSPNLNRPFFPRNNFGPRGHGMMGPRPPPRRFHPPGGQHGGDVGPPGCTVLMENVPYKAGLSEILEFFVGYTIPGDNVLRRYNENGTPSGEAKVIFSSPEEARQAVNEKRFHKIRERTIYLTMC